MYRRSISGLDLKEGERMKKFEFETKLYHAYQLQWLISHGFTIRDFLNALIEKTEELDGEGSVRDQYETAFANVEYESGLGSGSIWACKEEFLDHEFENDEYVESLIRLLPDATEMLEYWRREYHKPVSPELEVNTSAGAIRAYRSTDPGQPGIFVVLQPAGYEEEIDLSFVSVYEDPEYVPSGEEVTSKDVVIMTYGDATQEDYTSKDVVRREEVITGLGTGGSI